MTSRFVVLCALVLSGSQMDADARSQLPTKQSRKFISGYATDPSLAASDYVANFNKAYHDKGGRKADGAPYETPVSDVSGCCQICPTRFYKQLSFLELPPEVHTATERNFWAWYEALQSRRAASAHGSRDRTADGEAQPQFSGFLQRQSSEQRHRSQHGEKLLPSRPYPFELASNSLSHNNKFSSSTSFTPRSTVRAVSC